MWKEKAGLEKGLEVRFEVEPWKNRKEDMEAAILRAFSKWQEILFLQGWKLYIKVVPQRDLGKENLADSKTDYTYLVSIIRIAENVTLNKIDEIARHELLHIKIGQITNAIENLLVDRITAQEMAVIMNAEEQVVEGLSRSLGVLSKKRRR